MSYHLLPNANTHIIHYIDCIGKDSKPPVSISNSLSSYLYEIKEKLDNCSNDWDFYKKYTNTYEYIDSIIPNKRKCVSKYKPLSRSYFKMIEIINTFHLKYDSKSIRTFHLAEGPGGFIEAIVRMRNSSADTYIGMTILDKDNDPSIPGWKKSESFLKQHPNVIIERGADETGNIISLENFAHCKDKYASSMDLITADGGFDFSVDFNSQEINISKLLISQIFFALVMQKKGGSFVLKIFDCFMQHTIDALFILSAFYERIYVTKPNTSRTANSEKYIVCKGFLFSSATSFYTVLYNALEKVIGMREQFIHRFITVPVPSCFVSKLEECNAIIGQSQMENIYYTLTLVENHCKQEKIDSLIRMNVQKCIQWCVKHNVEHQTILAPTNIFS